MTAAGTLLLPNLFDITFIDLQITKQAPACRY